MNKIIIYKSRKKAVIITASGLLLVVAGGLFFQYTNNNLIGWCITIFAILCVIFGIGSWIDKTPYIILTENGIIETSGIHEEIEWDAIRYVDEFYYRGQYFIRLLLDRNYKSNIIQSTWFNRFDKLYAQEGLRAIFIRIGFLEVNSLKLSHFINQMLKADAGHRIKLLNDFRTSVKKDS